MESQPSQVPEDRHHGHFRCWSIVSAFKTVKYLKTLTDRPVSDSVTIISGFRLHFLLNLDFSNPDVIWLASEEMNWSIVEVNIAVVCGELASPSNILSLLSFKESLMSMTACLPSLKPIMHLALGGRIHGTQTASTQGRGASSTKASNMFHSIRKLSSAFNSNRSSKRVSNDIGSMSTGTANDTQPFAKRRGHEFDGSRDTEMSVMASNNPGAEAEVSRGSDSDGILVTRTVRVDSQEGVPAEHL